MSFPPAKALRNGQTVLGDEIVIHLPDGRAVTTLVNARPIYGEDGEAVSVVVTMQDITQMEEIKSQRTEFLGMVSHELRTPLAAIKGSAASMLGTTYPLDPTETRQFLRIIDEQADLMRHLINDLVDMTQIESGTLSVTPEPTSLEDLVELAREAFIHEESTNTLTVDLAPDLPRAHGGQEEGLPGTQHPPCQRIRTLPGAVRDKSERVAGGCVHCGLRGG